ncbi:MAG: amidohydrolase family protein [Holophagales bacterium]|nr:MAG: amidohydrolase family protein [Holophagales bacterium]
MPERRIWISGVALALAGTLAACAAGVPGSSATPPATPATTDATPATADLVLRGGRVVTMDAGRPEARAVAVRGDRIAAVGSEEEVARWIGPRTEVVDLGGRLLIPAFIEGHGHFLGLGQSRTRLDLTKARSFDEIVAQVAAAARQARPGQWILGRGWHQDKWNRVPQPNVEGVPLHAALSRVSPENPVVLEHASGHAALVNARALAAAGIGRATPDPEGGEIVHDAQGEPSGLLRESAQDLVDRAMAADLARRDARAVEAERRTWVRLAAEEALAHGIATFHDAGVPFSTVDFYRQLAHGGELPLRLYVMVAGTPAELDEKLARYRSVGGEGGFVTVRAIKAVMDGALGSHGAWLLEPYADLPESRGLALMSIPDLRRTAELALRDGYQLGVHAIGDRANREVLDVYAAAFAAHPEARDLRWRIEHAQHLDPADLPRFAKLGVIASMQSVHCTSDGPWVPRRLGEERARRTSYRWRELLDSGAVVANGTDVPVESLDPIANFYAAVTRKMANGERFVAEQRMTREEALRSYTTANAFMGFEEADKGSIAPGKLADLTVLSRDLLAVPEEEILEARVDLTMVGGRVAYRRSSATPPRLPESGAAALPPGEWMLAAFAAGEPVPAGVAITARLDGTRLAGSAGCNRYFAEVVSRDGRLSVSPVGATRMACPGPGTEAEAKFLARLGAVVRAEASGDELRLDYELAGTRGTLRFVRAPVRD